MSLVGKRKTKKEKKLKKKVKDEKIRENKAK